MGLRVLVADDEHLVATAISAQLEALGHQPVGPAGSGREAVAMGRECVPDLALLDIQMPDGDGIGAARTLLQELMIPTVILSAYSDQESIVRAEDSGVFAYLLKPVEDDQLRATLAVAWGRYQKFCETAAENSELRRRLTDRKIVERAKWILVSQTGVDEANAMRLLLEHARQRRERVVVTAQRVMKLGAQGAAERGRPAER